MRPQYQCCFCGWAIGREGHDPVTLTLTTEAMTISGESQELYCHSSCLKERLQPSIPILMEVSPLVKAVATHPHAANHLSSGEGLLAPLARIDHVALWATNLERACAFYERWFKATAGPKYSSTKRSFTSYFVSLHSGARLELMTSQEETSRVAHIAVSLGSRDAVDNLVREMKAAEVRIVSGPRLTGDGYYEAVVMDTEGNLVEITI